MSTPTLGAVGQAITGYATSQTTGAVNTAASGSNFILLVCAGASPTPTVSDSFSNTYTLKAMFPVNGTYESVYVYECDGGTGGTGHTATVSFGSTNMAFHALLIEVVNGVYDTAAYTSVATNTTQATGSITTASGVGALVLAHLAVVGYTTTTLTSELFGNVVASNLTAATYGTGYALATKVVTTSTAVTDTFTLGTAAPAGTVIFSMKYQSSASAGMPSAGNYQFGLGAIHTFGLRR